ncbi:unnamed protein product [Caenorhabditis bovis]|uniref:Protein kinase domain-containing protein n=1 Tax=Caenorhabditis bovis TaxID=2654633 RepID=A0A8S1EJL5_9PELO|nr:unnamed protein product [Caenorhabditis bovis]
MSNDKRSKETICNPDDVNNMETQDTKSSPVGEMFTQTSNPSNLSKEKDKESEKETQEKTPLSPVRFRRVMKITNSDIDEYLTQYPFYHGYLLHEYQSMLLRSTGDFVMRLSVRYHVKKRKRASREPVDKTTPGKAVIAEGNMGQNGLRYNIVFGVYTGQPPDTSFNPAKSVYGECLDDNHKSSDILDVPMYVEHDNNGKWAQFYFDKKKKFATIDELITHYKTNQGTHKDRKFLLLRGVPLQIWELDQSQIEFGSKRLGEGAFGEVKSGTLKVDKTLPNNVVPPVPVAIKILKSEESKGAIKLIMHEARLQLCLRHRNVLKTLGVSILKSPIFIVTEFCPNGSLKDYLQKNKTDVDEKIRFCLGSARGVEYLHSKLLIHRDLATRNVLLNDSKVPKIADFGLARYGSSYKMTASMKIPIRYLAPEVLTTYKFSQRSDVYSFGLVIWEIFENGQEPYVKPQPHQEALFPKISALKGVHVKELIRKELWVKFNSETPPQIAQFVAERIFVSDERKRVTMPEIVVFLKSIYKSSKTRETTTVTMG